MHPGVQQFKMIVVWWRTASGGSRSSYLYKCCGYKIDVHQPFASSYPFIHVLLCIQRICHTLTAAVIEALLHHWSASTEYVATLRRTLTWFAQFCILEDLNYCIPCARFMGYPLLAFCIKKGSPIQNLHWLSTEIHRTNNEQMLVDHAGCCLY